MTKNIFPIQEKHFQLLTILCIAYRRGISFYDDDDDDDDDDQQ